MLVSDLKFLGDDVIRYTLQIKAKPGQTDTVKEYILQRFPDAQITDEQY